jgi:hypothetical protein
VPYYLGQPVPLAFTLTDANGNPVNPVATQPVLTVNLPGGTTATPSLANVGTGLFQAAFATTVAGRHTWTWSCTDATYPGGGEDAFDVWALSETAILQFADAKATLSISAQNTTWDSEVREFNESITAWLEWYCGSVIVQTVVETLRVGGLVVQLSKPPVTGLVAWTSVPAQFVYDTTRVVPTPPSPMFPIMVYGVTYPLSQLFADPVKGWVRHTSGLPFYYGPYMWQYTSGYAVTPFAISYAAKTVLRHLWGLEHGGAGGAAGLGASDEETTATPFGFAVPNRVIETLAPYQIPAAIA